MHSTSKGFRKFKSRIDYLQEDMETVAVILKNKELLADENKIFKLVSASGQPKLYQRKGTSGSREIVLRHLQNTLFVSYIKELYEEVLIYCEYALGCAALTSPEANRLVGEQNVNFLANDILSKSSKEEIISMVISKIFRGIENKRDTLLLISAINDRLNLGIAKDLIQNAMPYLEARHKFVHSDGAADELYKQKYPDIALDEKGKIKLNTSVIQKASSSVMKLIVEYDTVMKQHGLFPSSEFE